MMRENIMCVRVERRWDELDSNWRERVCELQAIFHVMLFFFWGLCTWSRTSRFQIRSHRLLIAKRARIFRFICECLSLSSSLGIVFVMRSVVDDVSLLTQFFTFVSWWNKITRFSECDEPRKRERGNLFMSSGKNYAHIFSVCWAAACQRLQASSLSQSAQQNRERERETARTSNKNVFLFFLLYRRCCRILCSWRKSVLKLFALL